MRWFVTDRGIVRQAAGATDLIDAGHGLPVDRPFSIALGDSGSVWVGFRASGVVRITSRLRVEMPGSTSPHPRGYVRALHRSADGNLWASDDDGIWVLSAGAWSLLTDTFGLLTPAIWPITSSPRGIYLGTLGVGVLRLRLAEFREALPVVRVLAPEQGKAGLALRWVVATRRGLVAPADVMTRWQLDEEAWSDWSVARSVIAPAMLSWRRHTLRVEARTPLGLREKEAGHLEFVVPPPLWWRHEVLLPVAALLASLCWVSVLLRRRRIQNRALARRVREAERMELVGSFAAGLAHELNNLLTTILVNAELVHDDPSGTPEPTPADEIRRAASRAAEQVRSMQAFTRDRALVLVPIDLRDALSRQRVAINALFGARVATTWELGDVPVRVRAEVNGLAGMMRALAENAQDAMHDAGRFHVRLSVCAVPPARRHHLGLHADGRYAEIALSDSGAGMSSEQTRRAFEPYFSTRDRPGLGLALVYGLTHRFGGAVEIHADPGRGTTVRLFLPVVDDAATPGPAAT